MSNRLHKGQKIPADYTLQEYPVVKRLSYKDMKAREEQICQYSELVKRIVLRFTGRGIPYEDLVQVGYLALIKAIDRFDTSKNVKLSTFVTSYIIGGIKHHFRDNGWQVKVSRSLKDSRGRIFKEIECLTNLLGRSPTIAEISARLKMTNEAVIEIMELGGAYAPCSIEDRLEGENGRQISILDSLHEESFEDGLINKVTCDIAKEVLTNRERTILDLRYKYKLTQSEIAQKLDISQMHVSRLLRNSLIKMRECLKSTKNGNNIS